MIASASSWPAERSWTDAAGKTDFSPRRHLIRIFPRLGYGFAKQAASLTKTCRPTALAGLLPLYRNEVASQQLVANALAFVWA